MISYGWITAERTVQHRSCAEHWSRTLSEYDKSVNVDQYKKALKDFLHTHSFYAIEEFVICKT
jgi:hypothetical protein